jgi:hypothetical protein
MPVDAGAARGRVAACHDDHIDLPVIFESTVNRVLPSRYQVAQPTYRQISAQRNFHDFRPHEQMRIGDFPTLQPVLQSGEIKFGTFGDSKEVVAVAPYAIQFAISRRMLIDDNVGAIDQMLGSYGDTVSRFEEATFYAMKAANGGNGPTLNDGNAAVFNAAKHGNLAATGTAISSDALGLGRASMRKQKNHFGRAAQSGAAHPGGWPDKETEADRTIAVDHSGRRGARQPVRGQAAHRGDAGRRQRMGALRRSVDRAVLRVGHARRLQRAALAHREPVRRPGRRDLAGA